MDKWMKDEAEKEERKRERGIDPGRRTGAISPCVLPLPYGYLTVPYRLTSRAQPP